MKDQTLAAATKELHARLVGLYLALSESVPFRSIREPLVKHFKEELVRAETCDCSDEDKVYIPVVDDRCWYCGGKRI